MTHPVPAQGRTDRAGRWLPLLRGLDAAVRPIVFKRSARALGGLGDVDAFAARESFADVEREFRAWAADDGRRVVTVCRHDWRGPTFVAVHDDDPAPFVLDVKVGRFSRGSVLFRVGDLDDLTVVDDLGITHLRPGADGAMTLLVNGTSRTGSRVDTAFASKGILAALRSDPDGALAFTRVAGPAGASFRRAIRAVLAGRWSRRDLGVVVAYFYARGLARPDLIIRQLHWRFVAARSCTLSARTAPSTFPEREAWLGAVARSHAIEDHPRIAPAVEDDLVTAVLPPSA